MNASCEWLRALVPVTLSPEELRDLLTSRCATVDDVVALRADLAGVVVGRVVEAGKHPDSDRLSVTKVDAGTGELFDVVCGAPNVKQGALYPFAPVGTVLPGGLKLDKRKIRGQLSNGMLCSARELGLGQDHEGIMELDLDVPPGTPFLEAVQVGDTRLVVDVTPNRPDLLSHVGLAREISAATGIPMVRTDAREARMPVTRAASEGRCGPITIRLEDAEGAPRYMGAVIRGVKVAPSPEWLVQRLEGAGVRSINNVVDITNYMLHELGQPMHAFDLAKIGGNTIVIRRARKGEKLKTLDGSERKLTEEMTVIADADSAQAVAGVMGGGDSELTDETTDIVLEVAYFEPRRVRATRRALGMSTDASYRFERGIDPTMQPHALQSAVAMIVELAGGTPEGDALDLEPSPAEPVQLALRPSRVARLLGVEVPAAEISALLGSVGFEVVEPAGQSPSLALNVTVPGWRVDVTSEVDLIEEVARLRGYDSFPDELRPYRPGNVPEHPVATASRRIRELLTAAGLYEARPMPFVVGADEGYQRVANPLAEDEAYLRRSILESLAKRAEYNLARMQGNVRLFEVGSVFRPTSSPAGERGGNKRDAADKTGSGANNLPVEAVHVGAILMGDRRPPHFTEPKPPAFDAWDAKGLAERLAASAWPDSSVELIPADSAERSGVLWEIHRDGERAGDVRRVELDAPVWAAPAFGVELVLAPTESANVAPPGGSAWNRDGDEASGDGTGIAAAAGVHAGAPAITFRPLPATPAVEFDLALVTPDSTPAAKVEQVIRASAGELLESLVLFDEYRGPGVDDGHRSLGWRLTFRHPERTLRDKEIEGRRQKLLKTLESEIGVRQRTS
jgi:phenylalanyl-tRNA synthetase beta chain